MKRARLVFSEFQEVLYFILKFHTVLTLCGKYNFHDYIGHVLWFNLSSTALVPVGAVLLFIARKTKGLEVILCYD